MGWYLITEVIDEMLPAYTALCDMPDWKLPVKYPKTPGYRPSKAENKYNAW